MLGLQEHKDWYTSEDIGTAGTLNADYAVGNRAAFYTYEWVSQLD